MNEKQNENEMDCLLFIYFIHFACYFAYILFGLSSHLWTIQQNNTYVNDKHKCNAFTAKLVSNECEKVLFILLLCPRWKYCDYKNIIQAKITMKEVASERWNCESDFVKQWHCSSGDVRVEEELCAFEWITRQTWPAYLWNISKSKCERWQPTQWHFLLAFFYVFMFSIASQDCYAQIIVYFHQK